MVFRTIRDLELNLVKLIPGVTECTFVLVQKTIHPGNEFRSITATVTETRLEIDSTGKGVHMLPL